MRNQLMTLTTNQLWILPLLLVLPMTDRSLGQFITGDPVNFGSAVNSEFNENSPALSPDGLTLYFHSNRSAGDGNPAGLGGADIWVSRRASLESEWGPPESFASINTPMDELSPFISSDGLIFLYGDGAHDRTGRIYQMTRSSQEAAWQAPVALPAPINDAAFDSHGPYLSEDGLSLLFHSNRLNDPADFDIWEAKRSSLGDDDWTVERLGPNINTAGNESKPVLTGDGLTLLFASDRPGGEGGLDIWMAQRDSWDASWGMPVNLGPIVNTPAAETPGQVWDAGRQLLFKSGGEAGPGLPGAGGSDMFYVSIVPEPSTFALSLAGMLALVVGLRRHRLRHASIER